MILAIILSSLALLAAVTAVGLSLRERKRNQERNIALLSTVTRQINEKTDALNAQIERYCSIDVAKLEARIKPLEDRVQNLESGTIPDYEKAKEAAAAVNNFNAGITGILGFDPYEALQAQRNRDRGGDHG